MLWDIEGAGGVARRVTDPTLPKGFLGTVWVSPTGGSVAVGAEADYLIDLDDGDPIELQPSSPFDTLWAAYSPDGERFVTVNDAGLLRLRTSPRGSRSRFRPDVACPIVARSPSPPTDRPSSWPTPTAP